MAKLQTDRPAWVRVIIVNYNAGTYLQACVDALAAQTFEVFEAVVVDNASTDGSAAALSLPDERFRLIRNESNLGFAAANNIAAQGSRAPWLATLNPDTVADPNWLEQMRRGTERYPHFSMFGATLIDAADGTIVDGFGDELSIAGIAWRRYAGRPLGMLPEGDAEAFSPCAAAAIYARQSFEVAGGFDETFFCYVEDVDLGFRLRLRGERCMQLRNAIVRHHGSGIAGKLSDFALFHSYRNRLWLLFKDMPLLLLFIAAPLNIMGSVLIILKSRFTGERTPVAASLKGLLAGLAPIEPLRRRGAVQRSRRISTLAVARSLVWNLYRLARGA